MGGATESLIYGLAIAIVAGVVAPLVLIRLNNTARRKDKQEDWARQDMLDKRAAQRAAQTERKVDKVHALVNGDKTEAMRDRLIDKRVNLLLMRKVLKLSDDKPTKDELAGIKSVEKDIAGLEKEIARREEQQKILDAT